MDWLKPSQPQAGPIQDRLTRRKGAAVAIKEVIFREKEKYQNDPMQRPYLVCKSCGRSWIWQDRLVRDHTLTCRQCGTAWQGQGLQDLKASKKKTQWAQWNFSQNGHKWPVRTYKQAFLEPPPGLAGGHRPKKAKVKFNALQKAVQEHWETLPAALKTQCEAIGLQALAPPSPPDLSTLIKEHLESLPSDLKQAVGKLVEPDKPEPTLPTKLKQSVGQLKQLAEKKAALQHKADAVKAQYSALLAELKEMQAKIEGAQKELQDTTTLYNQQIEKEKTEAAAEEEAFTLAPEKLMTILAKVGVQATAEQVTDFARQIEETAAKRRKCG